ncbi:MAPEG family protein [Azospirillum sp.]|uniref:MAPEG family protein n=1 Tax=Azospirillum sp. TaxID=34012 RepID=UPI002D657993|nr:MAPEG family protein [Azospirillum sp.]HYD69636.1 MAPEG family protein [Azospirillum sp.]
MARDRRLLPLAAAVNVGAVAVTLVLFVALAPLFPAPEAMAALQARLALAARLSLWPALVLFAMVCAVMAARGRSLAFNPIDDAESRGYRVAQRVLSNTVEQTLVFLPGLWALSVLLPVDGLGVPRLATALFVAGRLLFWAGYHVHPYLRAPGMAMTFTVNLVVLGWAVVLAL